MIDSALGLDADDMSEAAKTKRQLRGLADLNGIGFVAKVAVEPNKDPRYPDQNRLDHPVLPNEKEWRAVMNGEDVPARPSKPRSASGGHAAASAQAPAWAGAQQKPAAVPATTGAPLWHRSAEISAPAPQPTTPATQPAKPGGPAWLNG
jgi:hypothetical protein